MAINKINYCGETLLDLSEDTATAANVLKNKIFHLKSGEITTGTMTNRGAVIATIDEPNEVYKIPKGYHNGNGTVTATYSGYNVVTGTYTGTTTTSSFTISGLGFKPIGVVVAAFAINNITTAKTTYMYNVTTVPVTNPATGSSIYGSKYSASQGFLPLTGQPITINNDGFTCSRSSDFFPYNYLYVVWG